MSRQAEEVVSLSEQLAEYRSAVADVVRLLGHAGDSPDDLRDAVGQIEALLTGEDSLERNDLSGLAEDLRRNLAALERRSGLLADARAVCERRTAERDEALRERDATARSLARALSLLEG